MEVKSSRKLVENHSMSPQFLFKTHGTSTHFINKHLAAVRMRNDYSRHSGDP